MSDNTTPAAGARAGLDADWIKRVWDVLMGLQAKVDAIDERIRGDSEESHSWQLRDARREIDELRKLGSDREQRLASLAAENRELRALIDPVKSEVESWSAWRNKILLTVVTGAIGMVLTGVGAVVVLGLKVSVGQ